MPFDNCGFEFRSKTTDSTRDQPTRGELLRGIGICILNWNTKASLLKCIKQLTSGVGIPADQIVVVDNASRDASAMALKNLFPTIIAIESPVNLGYSKGNNIGANYLIARGFPYLLFLNPDVLLERSTLTAMMHVMHEGNRVGCVGAVPTRNGVPVRTAVRNRPSPIEKIVLYGPLARICGRRFARSHFASYDRIKNGQIVDAICGAVSLFRTEAFVAIGGFDEAFFLYEEEYVIAERLRSRGWNVAICLATYQHDEAASSRQIPFRRRLAFVRSESLLIRRYFQWPGWLCFAVTAFRIFELAVFFWYYAFQAMCAAYSHGRFWSTPLRRWRAEKDYQGPART
jgi:hypothetical protein